MGPLKLSQKGGRLCVNVAMLNGMDEKNKKQAKWEQFISIQGEGENLETLYASWDTHTRQRGARETTVTWEMGRIKSTGTLTIKME